MLGQVHRGNHCRTDRGRCQVDAANPTFGEQPGMLRVGVRRRGVKGEVDLVDALQ